MLIPEGQQKRLVESYKINNKQLRKQLENLNNEIDKIIAFKTNRIGLKKLPAVDKSILKTQDVKLLQLEVDNLRKRLEQVNKDNDSLKQRVQVNHMEKAKLLEQQLLVKKKEKDSLKKQVYYINKSIQTLNTTDIVDEQLRLYEKIEQKNQELIMTKKMQVELTKEIEEKRKNEEKKTSYINESVEHHKEVTKEVSIMASRIELPVTHKSQSKTISDDQWKNLKKQFLELKESKQRQQGNYNEENDRLRAEIRALQMRMKQKKLALENIRSHETKRKERNYSTLDNSGQKQDGYRYRNKNNAYKYNTKN